MEAVKISVEVTVNLSEGTQNFIKSLFGGAMVTATTQKPTTTTPAIAVPATAPATAKPATVPATAKPTTAKPATAKPAIAAPAAAPAASKNIEDVRKMLAQKVNEHRDVIKQKLDEFGAPSVTKLDPSKYDEMYNFLESL